MEYKTKWFSLDTTQNCTCCQINHPNLGQNNGFKL